MLLHPQGNGLTRSLARIPREQRRDPHVPPQMGSCVFMLIPKGHSSKEEPGCCSPEHSPTFQQRCPSSARTLLPRCAVRCASPQQFAC